MLAYLCFSKLKSDYFHKVKKPISDFTGDAVSLANQEIKYKFF
jgi:hypothetical protein